MPTLTDVLAGNFIQYIVILIGIDVILGLVGAVMKKEFRFGKVAGFMHKGIIGYVFAFAVIALVGQAIPSLGFIVPIVFVLVAVALLASIFRNLNKMGIALPGSAKM